MQTDYRECQFCHVRIIFPLDAHGKKLPPVEYGEDPLGTVAVRHEATGEWRGRFLAKDEQIDPPDTRHALHHCKGSEHRRQRARWTSGQYGHNAAKRRRTRPAQPTLGPGMVRLYPGGTP
jgi:hypothetical protein